MNIPFAYDHFAEGDGCPVDTSQTQSEKSRPSRQKVGMTKPEIRRSINSQLLTVFFLPLGLAGLHLAFAMPIVNKMLIMFGMANTAKFVVTAAVSFAVFALFYTIVYRLTFVQVR